MFVGSDDVFAQADAVAEAGLFVPVNKLCSYSSPNFYVNSRCLNITVTRYQSMPAWNYKPRFLFVLDTSMSTSKATQPA